MKSRSWMAICLLIWGIALWLGARAAAQQCSSCSSSGAGLDHYGITVLGSCSGTSTCELRDCTVFFDFTDSQGNARCDECFADSSLSRFVDPQSALACITFVWQAPPPCSCPFEIRPLGHC